jgi:hypothetical protein
MEEYMMCKYVDDVGRERENALLSIERIAMQNVYNKISRPGRQYLERIACLPMILLVEIGVSSRQNEVTVSNPSKINLKR